MEQVVRVQKTFEDGTAQVLRIRESACSGDCHQCSGCGAAQQKMLISCKNPIGAQPGDLVIIRTESAPVLKAALMLYILPVLLLIGGYLAGEWLWQNGIWLGLLGLVGGFFLVGIYDKHLQKKATSYTITGFAKG